MTTATEKDTDMSNEPIYPLEEKSCVHTRSINQRLAPKRKMMTVEMDTPNADPFIEVANNEAAVLSIPFDNYGQAKAALNQIRKAMEGK